jgi:hypothetical protein
MDGTLEVTDDQMRSADDAMHKQMAELYRQQVLGTVANRDAYPDGESYKNRTLVHCKLSMTTYAALVGYAKARDMSINTAIKEILQNYFNETNG